MATGREIFKLFGTVALDGADEANKQLDGLEQNAKDTESSISTSSSGIGNAFKTGMQVVGTAVLAGITALGTLAVASVDSALELEATNAKYEVVFGEFTELADQMVADYKKLTPASEAAARTMVSGFQDLLVPMGFAREEATLMTGELAILTGALTNMNSATETTESVSAKFQSALTGKYSTLNSLGIVTSKEAVEARALAEGYDMSTEAAEKQAMAQALMLIAQEQSTDALAAYNEESLDTKTKMEIMKASFEDVKASLGEALLPVVNQLMTLLMDNMPAIQAVLEPLMTTLAEGLTAILPVLPTLIDTLLMMLEAVAPLLPLIADLIAQLLPPLIELIVPIIELLLEILEKILPPLIPIIELVADILLTVLGAAFGALEPLIDGVILIFTGLMDFITGVFSGDWEKAWGGIVDIFAGIFEGIGNLVKIPINFVIGLINSLFDRIGEIKLPDFLGGKTISLPQIPLLAKGTDYFEGGMAIVGEQGAELVNLPKGSSVTPADETKQMLSGAGNIINVYGDTSPSGIARRQRLDAKRRALGVI